MVHNDIYSHIESYKHLIWNHMKDEMESQLFDTIKVACNLDIVLEKATFSFYIFSDSYRDVCMIQYENKVSLCTITFSFSKLVLTTGLSIYWCFHSWKLIFIRLFKFYHVHIRNTINIVL